MTAAESRKVGRYFDRNLRYPERTPVHDPLQTWRPLILKEGMGERSPLLLSRSAWRRGATRVVSSCEWAPYPGFMGEGPQWHFAVTHKCRRAKTLDLIRMMRAFGLRDVQCVEAQNGTRARDFWVPLDPSHRQRIVLRKLTEGLVEFPAMTCIACEIAAVVGRSCEVHEPEGE